MEQNEMGVVCPAQPENGQTVNSYKIYAMAKQCLGQNLCEDKMLGCAETVNAVVEAALGRPIGGGSSTFLMYQILKSSPAKWQLIQMGNEIPGDIIISPSGTGNGNLSNGHVGIVAKFGILSNNSFDGLLEEKFTLASWNAYYVAKGGFPVLFYRAL